MKLQKTYTLNVYAVIVSFQDRAIYLLKGVLGSFLPGCWGKYSCPQKQNDSSSFVDIEEFEETKRVI
jgi:hypothetical protein